MEPFLPVSPETEEVGDSRGALDLKGVMDWETPEARVNCSRSSTLVRPLAAQTHRVRRGKGARGGKSQQQGGQLLLW